MSEFTNLFTAFYSQFILRDFFCKIIPGFLLIMSIAVSLTSLTETNHYLNSMSGWMWALAGGVSWIGGFVIQSCGEMFGAIRYFPKDLNRKQFCEKLVRFDQLSDSIPIQQRRFERLVVIQEACGNCYFGLIIASIILLANYLCNKNQDIGIEGFRFILIIVVIIFSIIFLLRMHFKHVERQSLFLDAFLDHFKDTK